MVIGALTVEIHIPDSGSLKDRRRVLRSLKDRYHSKFNVSVAQVDGEDLWQRATLAFCVVAADSRHADSVLASIREALAREHGIVLIDVVTELI